MYSHLDFVKERDDYLLSRAWEIRECPKCSKSYFAKKDFDNCGSYECSGGYNFLDIPAPRDFLTLQPCQENFLSHFEKSGYNIAIPLGIVRTNERTLFVSAAGQVFDDLIYGKTDKPTEEICFVIQPVIRLQGEGLVGEVEGFSTAFLNAATEQWNTDAKQHFTALDYWLDFFSSQEFYVGNLCLRYSSSENDWNGKNIFSEMLKINYGGLEIGIANYFSGIELNNNQFATMSDISIGLERFLWARNKTASYFDAIGPLTYAITKDIILIDTLRTLTLMSGAGVIPGHKNHGYKFRLLANKIANPFHKIPISELVEFYYKQWSDFIKPTRSLQSAIGFVRREIDRSINLHLNKLLKIDEDYRQSQEDFLISLLKDKIIDLAQLRCLLGDKNHGQQER